MALDSRIVRRPNGTCSFRAWVPQELRDLVPGGRTGQKWIALGTSDPAEARRLARIKSVDFDRQLDAARRRVAGQSDTLTQAEADRLAALWLSSALEKDEEHRREGLTERALDRKQEAADIVDLGGGTALAMGDSRLLDFEMQETLAVAGLHCPPSGLMTQTEVFRRGRVSGAS